MTRTIEPAAAPQIWAKTFEGDQTKPLTAHLLDVAAVAGEVQAMQPDQVAREAAAAGIDPDQLAQLRVWLASLHDLGKCSVAFQSKSRENWPEEFLGTWRKPHDPGHWRLTAAGMNRCRRCHAPTWPGVPRLRGDEPVLPFAPDNREPCSPSAQG